MVDLLEIARTWSLWEHPPPRSVTREVALPRALTDSVALIIFGARRVGKSTLMQQLLARYSLNPKHCAFLNFEDPRLAGSLTYASLDGLVSAFRAREKRARRLYFFLDEVQWVDGWQRWLRTQLDRPQGNYFILSSSNAHLLSGELASSLTGRHLPVELFPFTFDEAKAASRGLSVEAYLERGGFPEPLTSLDGDRLLRQYFTDIVERDVRERLGARSSQPIRQVVQMVFESAGSELSLRRVAGAAGIAIETAAAYLEACEAAHLLFACPFFAFSERKRATMNKKYYPVDPGLRRVSVTQVGADRGKALECATFVSLRRRFPRVYYWRGRGEVDFVVQSTAGVVPVQVTWDAISPRHERSLTEFYEAFPQASESITVTAASFASFEASLEA